MTPSAKVLSGFEHCHVHAVFPGFLSWLLMSRAYMGEMSGGSLSAIAHGSATRLNWKGRIAQGLRHFLKNARFPGEDAEWLPWAKRRLSHLLLDHRPDVVISSHEPASSLLLGLEAKRKGFSWIADLGDPVCTPYTLPRWRGVALRLEATCMREADGIVVPNQNAKDLYTTRHGVDEGKIFILPQGYDDRSADFQKQSRREADGFLHLVFAGRVYAFRDPKALLHAVADEPSVRLTMILADPPDDDLAQAFASVSRIRFLCAMSHADVRAAQLRADILISIGNKGTSGQVPAKTYEYMGVSRPILHLYDEDGEVDIPTMLVALHKRGWSCPNEYMQIRKMLERLTILAAEDKLSAGLKLDPVREYAFSQQGRRLESLLAQVTGSH